ncbi:hypothetical protein [Campylobacter geochelonis]|uniref:Uncharacterized protein n=1 Tax=Campylobacter geochelonis TaxID=1780362 RepID=A0A128EEZ9_9BACT|nr:hypothetical protein [Campylobacter geochelonis]QKF70991.1 hypothetical protein CGEO_0670 [Campylobacter geochelonis]CZE47111.1 Uncharacterised protein [Campylobacter geochelonis]CZE47593.1 Uncharacterised protein [Campylobacter geochelonis]CZE50193.1 Uncharacterised protein [Campylobacter geochelonis]
MRIVLEVFKSLFLSFGILIWIVTFLTLVGIFCFAILYPYTNRLSSFHSAFYNGESVLRTEPYQYIKILLAYKISVRDGADWASCYKHFLHTQRVIFLIY